jgi:hypothetical protein
MQIFVGLIAQIYTNESIDVVFSTVLMFVSF